MSELRNQLEEAKSEYDALRYPGNLMADLNATRPIRVDQSIWRSGGVRWLGGLAAAAAVGLIVFVQIPAGTTVVPQGNDVPSGAGPVWLGQTPPLVSGTAPAAANGPTMVEYQGPATQPAPGANHAANQGAKSAPLAPTTKPK